MRDSVDASPTGSVNGNAAPVVDANLVLVNGQATPDSGEAAAGRGSSGQGTSGDDGKMCIICIERLMDSGHEIGRPDSGPCRQHLFHLHCLTKWAEQRNECPIDRVSFTTIEVISSSLGFQGEIDGDVLRTVGVQIPPPAAGADEDDHHGGNDGLSFEPPPPLPAAFIEEMLAARRDIVIIRPDDILN